MASSLNEESVEKKLKTVNNTQDSIQSLSLWIIHHKTNHDKIVELWLKVLKKTVHPSHRLTLLYLCNDVIQNCKKKKAFIYNATFKEHLPEAAALVRDMSIKGKVERIFNIWEDRGVFDGAFVKSLLSILNGKSAKHIKKKRHQEDDNAPISPPGTPYVPSPKQSSADLHNDNMTERDAEESARILAEFKPHEMIDQITAFQKEKTEIEIKAGQLSHLKLDAASIENIKRLKDRQHGSDFSNHFDEACTKLEDVVKRQTKLMKDQKEMLDTLQTSETFYEEQYREAKIVANAYKNFGARINNMKKRLDELKKTFPEPESPVPSPDVNAPSPGNTPPHDKSEEFGYNSVGSVMKYQENSWEKDGTKLFGSSTNQANDDLEVSPPLEAPSPEGSPTCLNLGGSETTSANFESRLASFFNKPETSSYTPHLSSSNSKSYNDDGSATPLDDEAPTTPVQDEISLSPKRPSPPKKENPIDFLSRLINQSSKTTSAKAGAPSFLDSLSPLLSNVGSGSDPWKAPSPPPQSSPLGYQAQQPPSPTQFPPHQATPQMVPPPPIPNMSMPVPPPLGHNMDFSVPPPPPPPPIIQGMNPNFNSPPPGFQQTSPGQKENWPERGISQSPETPGSLRSTHNSVLKELVPADSFDSKLPSKSSSLLDDMELVSDEEKDDEFGPGLTSGGDAQIEFAQKLKQKTLSGSSLKSHVHVPSSGSSNLLTLTRPNDLDEDEMIDSNTVLEESPGWVSHKSSHKSRSRSRSRSKEKSHKHKKKKKHRRSTYSDEEDLDPESKHIGSIVKRVDPRSESRDKYEDDDLYKDLGDIDERDIDERDIDERNRKLAPFHHSVSKDYKDPVEAYTQAYRNAMLQQINAGKFGGPNFMPNNVGRNPTPPHSPHYRHGDPRRGGFRKY